MASSPLDPATEQASLGLTPPTAPARTWSSVCGLAGWRDMEQAGVVGCLHPVSCWRAPQGPGMHMGVRGAGPGQGPVERVYDQTLVPSPHSHSQQAELTAPKDGAQNHGTHFLPASLGTRVRQVSPATTGCPSPIPEGAPPLPCHPEASLALTGTRKMLPAGPRS